MRRLSQRALAARLAYAAMIGIAVVSFLIGVRVSKDSPAFVEWAFPDSVWATK